MSTRGKEEIAREAADGINNRAYLHLTKPQLRMLTEAFQSAIEDAFDVGYATACREDTPPSAAQPQELDDLREAACECLSWMSCECGHPACKRCRATKEANAAISRYDAARAAQPQGMMSGGVRKDYEDHAQPRPSDGGQWSAVCPKCGCKSEQKPGDACIRSHQGCDGIMQSLSDSGQEWTRDKNIVCNKAGETLFVCWSEDDAETALAAHNAALAAERDMRAITQIGLKNGEASLREIQRQLAEAKAALEWARDCLHDHVLRDKIDAVLAKMKD